MRFDPLKKSDIYPAAHDLVAAEWGGHYAGHFVDEANKMIGQDSSVLYGAFSETNELIAAGLITKDLIDFSLWGITWIVVRKDCRQKGVASELLDCLEGFAAVYQAGFPSEYCRIKLTTSIPDFYAKRGYETLQTWEEGTLMIKDLTNEFRMTFQKTETEAFIKL